MKLSIFNYATCINPAAKTTMLKQKLHQFFCHDGQDHLSTLFSLHPLSLPTILETMSALFNLPLKHIDLEEKRCYQDFLLYIVALPAPLPPFTMAVAHATQGNDFNLLDYIHLISTLYSAQLKRISSHAYYANCFDAYMAATNIPGMTSHWVSPTSALNKRFEIRAKTQNDRPFTLVPAQTSPYHESLPNKDIDSLTHLLLRIETAFPPHSSAKQAVQSHSSTLIAIAKAERFGCLKINYNQYINCLSTHASAIKLRQRPSSKIKKRPSLFERLRLRKTSIYTDPPPSPLSITIAYLEKQLDELGLTHHLLLPSNQSD